MIRIGLIGKSDTALSIAMDIHYRIKGVELLAWSTADKAMEGKAKAMGLKSVFSSPEALYEMHQLDLIIIADDPKNRLERVTAALTSDVDVLVEFPIATNIEDAEEAAKRIAGRPSQKAVIAYPIADDFRYRQIKGIIEEDELGTLTSVELSRVVKVNGSFTTDELTNRLIEDFFSIVYTTNKRIASLRCQAMAHGKRTDQLEDVTGLVIVGAFEHGGLFTYNLHGSEIASGHNFSVLGREGRLSLAEDPQGDVRFFRKDYLQITRKELDRSYRSQIERFINTIRSGNRPESLLEESVHAVSCAAKALKSLVFSTEETL